MSIQLASGLVAFLFCLGALPLVRRFAQRFHLYDAPGPLKIHHEPIPRLGGIAMFAGLFAGILTICVAGSKLDFIPLFIFAFVWLVGLIDDIAPLGSLLRFFVHLAAGSMLWIAGWRLELFSSSLLDIGFTSLFVAFLISAMNLLDGMDGLAAGTAAIASVGFLIVSPARGNAIEIALASGLLGACLAMLSVNAPPAKMFMGDCGSTLIGVVMAFLSLNWTRGQSSPHGILIPLLFLGVPLADAALAILRRIRSPKLLFKGDRRHFYDILLQRGWSVNRVLRTSLGLTGVLVFAGWLCMRGIAAAWLAVIVTLCAIAAGSYLLGSLQSDTESVQAHEQETPLDPAIE